MNISFDLYELEEDKRPYCQVCLRDGATYRVGDKDDTVRFGYICYRCSRRVMLVSVIFLKALDSTLRQIINDCRASE